MWGRHGWSGWILLLFLPAMLPAQPVSTTVDDLVVGVTVLVPLDELDAIIIPQATFDSLISRTKMAGDVVRADLDAERIEYLQRVDQQCQLTEAQLQKLHLAIRIETAEWMANYGRIRTKYVSKELTQDEYSLAYSQIIRQIALPLDQPCGRHSLFFKVLRRQATEDQWARFAEWERGQRIRTIQSQLKSCFPAARGWSAEQLDSIATRILDRHPEWDPLPPTAVYSTYVTILALEELKDEVKPLMTPAQWDMFEKQSLIAHRMEPSLRSFGLWPLPTE